MSQREGNAKGGKSKGKGKGKDGDKNGKDEKPKKIPVAPVAPEPVKIIETTGLGGWQTVDTGGAMFSEAKTEAQEEEDAKEERENQRQIERMEREERELTAAPVVEDGDINALHQLVRKQKNLTNEDLEFRAKETFQKSSTEGGRAFFSKKKKAKPGGVRRKRDSDDE